MPADITIFKAAPRTYNVPQSVALIASAALAEIAGNELGQDISLAAKLAIHGKITADDAFFIQTEDSSDLLGGDVGKEWSAKIVAGVQRAEQKARDKDLELIGYDPEKYRYAGLADADDPELLRGIVRVSPSDTSLVNAEAFTASGKWTSLNSLPDLERVIDNVSSVLLEPDLLAFTASAFLTGHNGVYLNYGVPLCFLQEVPMLAAGAPIDMTEGSFVYALVDATDTTAVMSVIMIKPGPQVYRRDGGAWVIDQATLDSLLSVTPPPIVELQGATMESVIAQTDASQTQQVDPQGDGSASAGAGLIAAEEEAATDPNEEDENAGSAVTASASLRFAYSKGLSVAQTSAVRERQLAEDYYASDEGYESGIPITASIATSELHGERREHEIRLTVMATALALTASLRRQQYELENVLVPLIADVANVTNATPNQRKAEPMRKYWLKGVGAVKIAWGTPNDFTRCRQLLTKYLGSRAAGYCAKLHKSKMGYWPGDKRNTGPTRGTIPA